MERLQKILARGGIASRRAAEALVTAGRVRVNGHIVTTLGTKADPRNDAIEVDGKRVIAEVAVYLVLHKPRGVVATMSDPEGRPTVRELLATVGARVFPVGRLDFATSGIILATNDGAFADGLLHPKKAVPKTYVIKVKGEMKPEELDVWRKGVVLEDGVTLPAEAHLLRYEGGKTWITLTIKEGRNQQIRRMGEATRFPVMRLARVSFAGITAEGLRPGQWRLLTREELADLKKTYGVPKTITSQERAAAEHGRGPQTTQEQASRRGPAGRDARARSADGKRGEDKRAEGKRGDDKRTEGKRPDDKRGGEGKPRGTATANRARGGKPGAKQPVVEYQNNPRYGGGAPGRRSYDTREDAGGGAGRGSSGGRYPDAQGERGTSDPPGRGGRTRTTGTGGGIGSRGDAGRVKGRRG